MRVFICYGGDVQLWCDTDAKLAACRLAVINGGYYMDVVPEPEDMPQAARTDYNSAIDWARKHGLHLRRET